MAVEIYMAKMSDHMEAGEIIRWLVKEGDRVDEGQVILKVMTDKEAAEVEAAASGVLKGVRAGADEGATVPVGETIAFIAEPDEEVPVPPPLEPPFSLADATEAETAPAPATPVAEPPKGVPGKVRATPVARRVARELGVDLSLVPGSGPGGRVKEEAVQAFAEAEHVLLATPLYTDCMPGLVKAFFEALEPLCGRDSNPDIAFIVQSGFGEAAHSRYLERYFQKLAARLGSRYIGTIIKGNCEGMHISPKMYRKILETFRELGAGYGATGEFDMPMVQKFAGPEKFPAAMLLLIQLMNKIGAGTALWDKPLKANGAYEQRFARPYSE